MPVIESGWAVEMDVRFARAETTFQREADAGDPYAISLPLTAFTDGSDFAEIAGMAGFSDWPPKDLLAIAQRQEG